jgi:hypothetical protein
LIDRGLAAYFSGDEVAAGCVLIPELEAALRQLLGIAGGSIFRENRYGGLRERTLDEILREPLLATVFGDAGQRICWYFRALLTDPRGPNIRNRISHGLLSRAGFDRVVVDRILHALLLIALVRVRVSDQLT